MGVTDPEPLPTDSFRRLVERLSEASVQRRWEAYRDIDWSGPDLALDREDPRWEAPPWDPVGASAWYRDQSPARRSELGLRRIAVFLKAGIEFETALNQGLLRFAATLPNGHPLFRYVYHEVTEEAQHSMMFQEVINRTGVDVPASPPPVQEMCATFTRAADESPAQFFLMALSGEEAFDRIQRLSLADRSTHPLLRRVYRIHVAEEARHLSFARGYLRDAVPRLPRRELRLLRFRAPFVVEWTAIHVFGPQLFLAHLVETAEVPAEARDEIVAGPAATALRRRCAARAMGLCQELDLVDPRMASVWSALGDA